MKRIVAMIAIATLLAAAWPSYAQPGPPGRRAADKQSMRPAPPPQREPPGRDARDREREQSRRASMSPEERQQLRRDIGDHGRDVYRDRKPRP